MNQKERKKFFQKLLLKFQKLPSSQQWKSFFKVLSKKEKILFFIFLFLFLGSAFYLSFNFYFENTKIVPTKGGSYREGIVGQPRIINPIYAFSDPERDLVEILFEGLMEYSQEGEILPGLAEKYEIKEGGKIYEFTLRKNLFWSDGQPLTVDDVLFTIQIIQNPAYKSPYLASWLDIRAEKIDEQKIRFYLKNPYFPFLELATLKILPKHIWQEVPAQNFGLAIYNLRPISSGPYQVEDLKVDDLGYITSLTLKRNQYYFQKEPYLEKIILDFFKNEEELLTAALGQKIKGFSLQAFPKNFLLNFKVSRILLPRYFALFLNLKEKKILSDQKLRKALAFATNKEEILDKVLEGEGKIVNSPLLPEIYGFQQPKEFPEYDKEKARQLLIDAGFKRINSEGIREKVVKKEAEFQFKKNLVIGSSGKEVEELQKCLAKDPEVYPQGEITGYFGKLTREAVIKFQEKYALEILVPQGLKEGTGEVKEATREKLNELCARVSEEILPLKLSLITVNQPQMEKIANLLKKQWRDLGIDLEIKTFSLLELEENYLRPRNFEILLFGQVLGLIPDPFSFWHSKQKEDPGLNLSYYENEKADELIIAARQSQDFQTLKENSEKLQDIILNDLPAIFLYNPFYLYFQAPAIKGFEAKILADPSKRFTTIENWYIKTKRVWK